MSHQKKATLLALFPGLGHLYLKRYVRAAIFFLLAVIAILIIPTVLLAITSLVELKTLGPFGKSISSPVTIASTGVVYGIIMIIIEAFFIGMYIVGIRSARLLGAQLDRDKVLPDLKQSTRESWDRIFPYVMSAPGLAFFVITVVIPIVVTFIFAGTNLERATASNPQWGISAIQQIFSDPQISKSVIDATSWTIIWTLATTIFPIALGLILAVTMNQKDFRFKRFFRPFFLLPWAVPAFVTILIFRAGLNPNGIFNAWIIKPLFGFQFSWGDPLQARVALILIQTWLGFAFIFIMMTGALQSVSEDLYEAARIDGASRWQSFRNITLPTLFVATGPILISQLSFNFNNFTIIYLITEQSQDIVTNQGSLATPVDIIISLVYRLVGPNSSTQNISVASILIIMSTAFIILISIWGMLKSPAFKEGGGI